MPQAIELYTPADYLPCIAAAAVVGGRFVEVTGLDANNNPIVQHPAAATPDVLGVAQFDADPADAQNEGVVTVVSVHSGVIMEVEAGGAVAVDDPLEANTSGQAVTATGGAGVVVHCCAKALTAAAAAGDEIFVILGRFSFTAA